MEPVTGGQSKDGLSGRDPFPYQKLWITEQQQNLQHDANQQVTSEPVPASNTNSVQLGLQTKDENEATITKDLGTVPYPKLQQMTDVSIDEFLARPLLISSFTMSTTTTFSPWAAFLTNPAVAAKLRNAYLIRGNMHLRFITQADAYTYGLLAITPTIFNKVCDPYASDYGAVLDIASQKEFEMVTPYFGPVPYLTVPNVGSTTDFRYTVSASIGPLSTNSPTAPVVYVAVYAWITELDIRVPYAQSGKAKATMVPKESKKDGMISKPLSAIAAASNILADVPFIGGLAKTAGGIASAVGNLASMFGFSRPTVLMDTRTTVYRPAPFYSQLAAPDYCEKVTTDIKCSKSIDPMGRIGVAEDQLSFAYITKHWGQIDTISFSTTDVAGAKLFGAYVSPTAVNVSGSFIRVTPTSSIAALFAKWTGTLEYSFTVICSPFHKGRLRIYWNPDIPSENPTNTTTMLNLEIQPGAVATMVVPWGRAIPYLPVAYMAHSPVTLVGTTNGQIYVEVDQQLQCPTTTAPVYVVVCVRAGDDFKLAVPSDTILRLAHHDDYLPGATTLIPATVSQNVTAGYAALPVINQSGLTNATMVGTNVDTVSIDTFGEDVISMRALLKRPCFACSQSFVSSSTTCAGYRFRRLPFEQESDPAGVLSVVSPWAQSYMSHIARSFIFNSGSTRVFLRNNFSLNHYMQMCRSTGKMGPINYTYGTTGDFITKAGRDLYHESNGAILKPITNGTSLIGIEIPDYSGLQMQVNDLSPPVIDTCVDFFAIDPTKGASTMPMMISYAAGEDFSFYGYCGPDDVYLWYPAGLI